MDAAILWETRRNTSREPTADSRPVTRIWSGRRILANVLTIVVIVSTCVPAVCVDTLPQEESQKFETLREELATVDREIEQIETKRDLFRQAERGRKLATEELNEARQQMQQDVVDFVEAQAGTRGQFEKWQSEYGLFVEGTLVYERLAADARARPYLLWLARTILKNINPQAPPAEYEAVKEHLPADPENASTAELLAFMQALYQSGVERIRTRVEQLTKEIQPTESARKHVEKFEFAESLDELYLMYLTQVRKEAGLEDLQARRVTLHNALTELRPDWLQIERAAVESQKKAEADALQKVESSRRMWLVMANVAVVLFLLGWYLWRRTGRNSRQHGA